MSDDAKATAQRALLLSPAEPAEVGSGLGSGRIERRLASFMALDIKNYSVMISRDEAGAHVRVGKDLAAVVRQIHKYGGHVLSFAGDGLLAEFRSAQTTLRSALAIQSGAVKRNRRRSTDEQIDYRIGINSGQIVVQSGRVGGDTINIAARLEQIAEPGGICISATVHSQVHRTVKATYTNLGAARLKNIRYPVGTYRVARSDGTERQMSALHGVEAVQQETRDYLPSIAILPLENLSEDGVSDYFSEGVVEDVIVSLAGLRELRVISRGSTLGYPSGRTDVREVGRMLDVRYVLSGSIRRSTSTIRASVQLSDAQSGISLWAEASEFRPGDLFETQDQLVRRIVTRIAPNIREEELRRAMRKRPENMTAYDRTLQALHLMDYMDKDMFGQARDVLGQAMEEDPLFAMPVAWSIWWYIIWVGQGWSTNPMDDFAAASALAERAIALDPNNALGLAMMAHLRSFMLHDYESALVFFARALNAGPGNPIVLAMYALTLAYVGRGQEAVRAANHAVQLSPLDHRLFLFHNIMAWANFAAGSDAEAAKWARASHSASPRFTANVRILIASLAAIGADKEARAAAEALMSLEPDFTLSRYERTLLPYQDPGIRARLLTCLRSAGLPP
jgi:adenylate cyclase